MHQRREHARKCFTDVSDDNLKLGYRPPLKYFRVLASLVVVPTIDSRPETDIRYTYWDQERTERGFRIL